VKLSGINVLDHSLSLLLGIKSRLAKGKEDFLTRLVVAREVLLLHVGHQCVRQIATVAKEGQIALKS
jgi:hypothetical protein